ncbi:U-megalopygitoxin(1)-Mo1-like [Epargyreus clarus]|uniref:U-megalopygitoxin(1)-Mo1-like n=1 Tax=Epargyreus clarus TaxID=520877 RepID=UPI003C2BEF78
MANMLRSLVVFLALTSVALAAVTIHKLQPKPDKYKDVEGCYIADLERVLAFGESAPCHKHCMEYRCHQNNYQTATCAVPLAVPPCVLVEDPSKHYPDCCPDIKCP